MLMFPQTVELRRNAMPSRLVIHKYIQGKNNLESADTV